MKALLTGCWLVTVVAVCLPGCPLETTGLPRERPDATTVPADVGTPPVDASMPSDVGVTDATLSPPQSCLEILQRNPAAPDSTYTITVGGVPTGVFCEMDEDGGGWTRVVEFDAARGSCVGDWESSDDITGCESRPTFSSCTDDVIVSATFDVPLSSYREVRGFVLGRQYFSTDAFGADTNSIDRAYVDGVSITHGAPRTHVWTLASGLVPDSGPNSCPCAGGSSPPPPAFVAPHYFCDTGNPGPLWTPTWYDEPLWDDVRTTDGTCATPSNSPAWFVRELPGVTSDPLEVRIMTDQCDEDVAITSLELYVR